MGADRCCVGFEESGIEVNEYEGLRGVGGGCLTIYGWKEDWEWSKRGRGTRLWEDE